MTFLYQVIKGTLSETWAIITGSIIRKMVLVFLGTLVIAIVAEAQTAPDHSFIMGSQDILKGLLGGLVAGAMQYGIVKQKLTEHDRRLDEHYNEIRDLRNRGDV